MPARSHMRQLRWVACLLAGLCLSACRAQLPGTGFGQRQQGVQQSPFGVRQPPLGQSQGLFPAQRSPLNPLVNPLAPPLAGAALPNPYRYNQYQQQNYVPITAYQNELNLDGSFSYGYSSADGTTAQAQGYVKNLGYGEGVEAQVIQGSYSYTSPEGTPITVRYIADENGFRAEGTGIPATPQPYFVGAGQQPYQQQGVLNPNLNPYQTPFRQLPTPLATTPFRAQGPGQQPLNALQQPLNSLQQQQQQQQRNFQQQQQPNSGQYQPEQPFNQLHSGRLPAQYAGQFGQQFGSNLTSQQAQQNANNQQQQQQQQQQQKEQQNEQQQALITQQLRGRSNQLVDPYGYNQYGRRFKKSPKK